VGGGTKIVHAARIVRPQLYEKMFEIFCAQ